MASRFWVFVLASSGLFAGNVVEHRDVEFARYGDVRLALDAAIPKAAGLSPAAIIVHGGGWVKGDRRVDVEPLFEPLSEAGIAWFSISYRLMNDFAKFGDGIE